MKRSYVLASSVGLRCGSCALCPLAAYLPLPSFCIVGRFLDLSILRTLEEEQLKKFDARECTEWRVPYHSAVTGYFAAFAFWAGHVREVEVWKCFRHRL